MATATATVIATATATATPTTKLTSTHDVAPLLLVPENPRYHYRVQVQRGKNIEISAVVLQKRSLDGNMTDTM